MCTEKPGPEAPNSVRGCSKKQKHEPNKKHAGEKRAGDYVPGYVVELTGAGRQFVGFAAKFFGLFDAIQFFERLGGLTECFGGQGPVFRIKNRNSHPSQNGVLVFAGLAGGLTEKEPRARPQRFRKLFQLPTERREIILRSKPGNLLFPKQDVRKLPGLALERGVFVLGIGFRIRFRRARFRQGGKIAENLKSAKPFRVVPTRRQNGRREERRRRASNLRLERIEPILGRFHSRLRSGRGIQGRKPRQGDMIQRRRRFDAAEQKIFFNGPLRIAQSRRTTNDLRRRFFPSFDMFGVPELLALSDVRFPGRDEILLFERDIRVGRRRFRSETERHRGEKKKTTCENKIPFHESIDGSVLPEIAASTPVFKRTSS